MLGRCQRLFEDGAAGHLDGFLLQIANHCIARRGDNALIGVLASGDDVEQCGLASAIGTDQCNAIASANAQTRVLEQDARTEGLTDVVYRENHSR